MHGGHTCCPSRHSLRKRDFNLTLNQREKATIIRRKIKSNIIQPFDVVLRQRQQNQARPTPASPMIHFYLRNQVPRTHAMGSRPLTPREAHNLPVDPEQKMLEREIVKAFEEFQQEQDEDVNIDEDGDMDMDSSLDEPVHICTELGKDNPDPFVPDEESSWKTKLTFFTPLLTCPLYA
ncbi:hypothetical protein M405DRAFT_848101 [Rhizopogon salebrosus TDB-379]|nr:hypothetical protein M405DRAFT_848101 [Rhizopogon salebrosus TDB-379]